MRVRDGQLARHGQGRGKGWRETKNGSKGSFCILTAAQRTAVAVKRRVSCLIETCFFVFFVFCFFFFFFRETERVYRWPTNSSWQEKSNNGRAESGSNCSISKQSRREIIGSCQELRNFICKCHGGLVSEWAVRASTCPWVQHVNPALGCK